VPDYGNHTIEIIDEAGSSSSLVGYSGASAALEVDEIAVPEPSPVLLCAIAFAMIIVWRHSILARATGGSQTIYK